MKLVKPLSFIAACLPGLPAVMCAAQVDSRVSAATVYADRAVVTRSAEVDLAQGENVLMFGNLPAGLADQSLQFSAHGAVQATILDVNAETAYVDSTPNARVKELEDQIADLGKQIRAIDDRVEVLGVERDFVRHMILSATSTGSHTAGADAAHAGGAASLPTLEEWEKLYAYSEETLGKIASEVQSLDERRSDLKGKKGALELQLGNLRGAQGKSVKNVAVRLSAPAAGRLEIALRYAVPGATWMPSYDARMHTEDRAVDLTYYGLVRNATGEDWSNIALTLSTARPGLGGGAPELRRWVVDVEQPLERAGSYRAKSSLAGSRMDLKDKEPGSADNVVTQQFLSVTGAANAPEAYAVEDRASVETNATSATFRIPSSASVPANNSLQKVSIASARLAADLQYESTPKLMEASFLSARAANSTDYPFLAGAMNTFLDDTFIAASRLKTVMPGEKFELHLGADEGIAVKRRLVNRFAENTGLTGNGRRVTYDILVTITNNRRTVERVAFKEPLPVSRNEKIVVHLTTPSEGDLGTTENPKEVTREEDGKMVWRLELKPGEKREVPIKFSVEYPAEITVAGLE